MAPVDVSALEFSASGTTAGPVRWWTVLDDPDLDAAIAEALGDNFELAAATARLRAAEATVRSQRAPLFPWLSASADVASQTDDPGPHVVVGLRASYELDLFGRIRSELRGEVQRREVLRADQQTVAIALAAEVATTWVAIAGTHEQLALLERQLEANAGMSEVVRARFLNGVVRQADALRQERLLEQTRAERIARQVQLEVLEHRLSVLLGRVPGSTPTLPATLPHVPPLPDAGVPAELLRRRPDVRAAEHALYAADADMAAAITDQFPRLTLDASLRPASSAALLEGWIASVVGSLFGPLFEAGKRRAEVKRTRAVVDGAVALYGDALLTALQEVEDALSRNRLQEEMVASVDRQVDLGQRTAEGLRVQYIGGLDVGYLDVLTAQTASQQLRRQQISERQAQLQLRIDLFRALAGNVTEAQDGR